MARSMKAMLVGLGAVIVLGGSAARVRADAVCGDVDGDGAFATADCQALLDIVAGAPAPPAPCKGAADGALQCGDLDDDGAITTADTVICLNRAAGNETLDPLCGAETSNVIPCPGGTATIARNINASQTWPASCTIVLDGTIFVSSNVVVTIEPGTVIHGKKSSSNSTPSALVFRRGARINAAGTADAPIIFTSDQPEGSRTKGDWGGVVLNGRAPVNVPGGEGLAEGLSNVPFGGNDPEDSSGVVSHVRIEFAGRQLTIDNELNLFTLNGVGAGTTIDHVQGHLGQDDCIEWFGGTVNSKFLVASACGDDGLDWQLGFTGKVQFGYVAQFQRVVEASGSHGIEADNNENGFNLLPRSRPTLCNLTLVGTRDQSFIPDPGGEVGILLRRGTAGVLANTIVEGFSVAGMRIQHDATANQACDPDGPDANALPDLAGNLIVKNSIFFNNGATGTAHCSDASLTGAANCTGCGFYGLLSDPAGTDFQGVRPPIGGPEVDPLQPSAWPPSDPRPAAGSSAAAGGLDCSTVDGFFTATSHVGAFEPGGDNWLDTPGGWVSFVTDTE